MAELAMPWDRRDSARAKPMQAPKPAMAEPKAPTVFDPASVCIPLDRLMSMQFADPTWIVPGILPTGLCILGGLPKVGKSLLSLQLALAVCNGGRFLDWDVQRGSVVYGAFEDSRRRIHDRVEKMGGLGGDMALLFPGALEPMTTPEGAAQFWAVIDHHRARLAILDTGPRAFPGINWNEYGPVLDVLGPFQQGATARDMCLLLVEHHRKSARSDDGDAVTHVQGSIAKEGAADASWQFYRDRGQDHITLRAWGRDLEDSVLELERDPATLLCTLTGGEGVIDKDTRAARVASALAEIGGGTASDVASLLGMDLSNACKELKDLVGQGYASKERRGPVYVYSLLKPSQQPPPLQPV